MHVDLSVIPGLLLLAAELLVLAAVGFIVVRVALGQADDRLAVAQSLVVGLALWGLVVNFALYLWPGFSGALVGWVAVLVIGAVLARRRTTGICPRPRLVAGLATVAVPLFVIVLASRQLLPSPDPHSHIGLTATIRAGGSHPPQFPWNPGFAAPYHYGTDLLSGLLTPPVGSDPSFVTELLDASIWISFALIVALLLLRRRSWLAALVLAPLLLAVGTTTWLVASPGVVQIPVPVGIPAPGLRAALAEIYVEGLGETRITPPNIWKPYFVLAYALALVVLERVANGLDRRWLQRGVLALLIGFLGLVDEAVAPVVLVLWAALEAAPFVKAWGDRPYPWKSALPAAAGPALAALLLATGGGVITAILTGESGGGLSLAWIDDTSRRPPLLSLTELSGGVGLLGLGPVILAGGALVLARRGDHLSPALVAGSGVFLLVALTLRYEYGQFDVVRLDGHARNFALLALLLALSSRLPMLRPRWRYASGAVLVALVVWPATVWPVRNISMAVGHGIQVANSQPGQQGPRQVYTNLTSERLAAYLRDSTAVDARVLSPDPRALSSATGRPNASGFTQAMHYIDGPGPEYLDAIGYLDPTAMRRLDIAYVHATDAWIDGLPEQARRWLNDPQLFELLVQDRTDALYRVRSAFLELEAAPAPASYEALRRAVPPTATVYLAPTTEPMHALRLASALAHAQLVGELLPGHLHLRTDFGIEPLGAHRPGFVAAPHWFTPSMFPQPARRAIWRNNRVAIYSVDGATDSIMPIRSEAAPPISVHVSDARAADERMSFDLTLTTRAPERWSGQDWLVLPASVSGLPLIPAIGEPDATMWFSGQIGPGRTTTRLTYEFDPRGAGLYVKTGHGNFSPAAGSGAPLEPGYWSLVLRLTGRVDRGSFVAHEHVAYVPVMQIGISELGEVTFLVYEGDLHAKLRSAP